MLNVSTTPKLRKKNLEDSVLTKSKRFVKDSAEDTQDTDTPKKAKEIRPIPVESFSSPPSTSIETSEPESYKAKKVRKPRHESEEGVKFLKAKAKKRALEQDTYLPSVNKTPIKGKGTVDDSNSNSQPQEDNDGTEPPKKKSKKNKKNRKKSKKGQEAGSNSKLEKRPETEERQRNESLAYLQLWCKHREHWKFEKLKQMWLLKHAISVKDINDKVFEILVDYISSAKGAAKVKTLQEMQEIMAGFEKKYGRQGGSSTNPNSVFNHLKPEKSLEEAGEDELKEYDRAREIVKILSNN